ncbi:MAG: hypothetical protein JJE30_07720 [Desulfuromonadales bacterium]|nr:hypothetical protein [Desulfuromonadales bacterium]
MRKLIPLQFFSKLLLVVMLTVTINGVHESAHAMQYNMAATADQDLHSELSVPHQCPCTPLEQHKDYDGCDNCINCTCHAPLTVQQFELSYNPSSILALQISNPFKFLPEVYLSKFIPPQNQA